jgi:hypothetical protein
MQDAFNIKFDTISFVVPVEGRPERSSPSTDIIPSLNA